MIPLSCINCCHNALQFDGLGTAVGYCTEHRKILLAASELTCGRHLRKDLLIETARCERDLHQQRFTTAYVSVLRSARRSNGVHTTASEEELDILRRDPVAEIVSNYGLLGTKILSLAQLNWFDTARSEIAMLSLGRSYVSRCIENKGGWTSGLHLIWWTREKLESEPLIKVDDFRGESGLPLSRRLDLARWSILMLRLMLLSDIGTYAKQDKQERGRVKALSTLAEDAAIQTNALSYSKLRRWVSKEATRRFDYVLSKKRYATLSQQLQQTEPT